MEKSSKRFKRSSLIAKSAIRDIVQKKMRSLTTIVVVMLVTGFPIAFLRTADSLRLSLNNESEELQLAHIDFQVKGFSDQLLDQIETIVKNESKKSPLVERRVVAEGATLNLEQTYPVVFIGTKLNTPPEINQILIEEGRYLTAADEVMIPVSFAEVAKLELGDEISIKGPVSNKTFEIVAFVRSIEWMNYQLTNKAVLWINEPEAQALAGLTGEQYTSLVVYLGEGTTISEALAIGEKVREHFNKLGFPISYVNYPRDLSIRAVLIEAADLISKYLGVCAILTIIICGLVMYFLSPTDFFIIGFSPPMLRASLVIELDGLSRSALFMVGERSISASVA
ncbi:MAG: hypothetical protein GF308_15405, partial [Candidatus Heimdallarchaeota archaeon]|nr:hypothetical protein [Candidatus Heimdallarchaeota archaeon]